MTEIKRRTMAFRAAPAADGRTTVAGYGVAWGSRNFYGEVFVPGCFQDTLDGKSETKPLIIGYEHREAIGRWTTYREDPAEGLYLEGPISDTTTGRDAAVLVKDGVITGLSIGFYDDEWVYASAGERVTLETPYGQRSYQNDLPTFYITRAQLVEVSLVMAPADDEARLVAVRSRDVAERASVSLPGLRDDADWDDVAYSMALLLGGRGAGQFSALTDVDHRSLYERLRSRYAELGRTAPPYSRGADFDTIRFAHDERDVFADEYLRRRLLEVERGCRGLARLREQTRAAARDAISALTAHTDPPADAGGGVLAELRSLTAGLARAATQTSPAQED